MFTIEWFNAGMSIYIFIVYFLRERDYLQQNGRNGIPCICVHAYTRMQRKSTFTSRMSRDYCSNSRMRRVTVHCVLQSTAKAAFQKQKTFILIVILKSNFHMKLNMISAMWCTKLIYTKIIDDTNSKYS